MSKDEQFMMEAVRLSRQGMEAGAGGPFGCVIVKDGQVIGKGYNQVTGSCDPTAHAEIVAIRDACRHLRSFQLTGCVIYSSCEPCPMCMGAIYWARPDKIYFASSRVDAADAGFDDALIYTELEKNTGERSIPMAQLLVADARQVFEAWKRKEDKQQY